jgi:hypothetical protein
MMLTGAVAKALAGEPLQVIAGLVGVGCFVAAPEVVRRTNQITIDGDDLILQFNLWRRLKVPAGDIEGLEAGFGRVIFRGRSGREVTSVKRGVWADLQLMALSEFLRVPIVGRRRNSRERFEASPNRA